MKPLNKISVLDCTLRDGGYINSWNFDNDLISNVIKSLVQLNVEFIEFGFISQTKGEENTTRFLSIEDAEQILDRIITNNLIDTRNCDFCVMLNIGEYNINDLPEYKSDNLITGIRLAFHKSQILEALSAASIIIRKGYKLFVQPMVILSYNNDEIVHMIESFSKLQIFSIYLVDSFGSMQNDDLRSILSVLQSHLPHTITIGFHAHNNLQLAFSNALAFIDGKHDEQQVIIDSSIMGMGRGAGNLNTELICDHLCKYFNSNYDILGVLSIIDTDFEFLKNKYNWGYKIAYFLSATCHCHPNYGTFFTDKKNLSVKNIFHLLSLIPDKCKNNFDNYFSEQLYIDFLTRSTKSLDFVKEKVIENASRPILIIASGPSVIKEKNKINDFIKKYSPYIFVVNHYSEIFSKPDFYFFSNQNRFDKFKNKISLRNTIVTSNIQVNNIDQREGIRYVDFSKIISNSKNNINNVSIYLIKFLMQNDQIEYFYFAGLDGFDPLNYDQNYSYNECHIYNQENMLKINEVLSSELSFLSKKVNIKSITASKVLSS